MLHRLRLVAAEPLQGILIEFCKDLALVSLTMPVAYAAELLPDAFSLLLDLLHELGNVAFRCSGFSAQLPGRPCVLSDMRAVLVVIRCIRWLSSCSSLSVFWLLQSCVSMVPLTGVVVCSLVGPCIDPLRALLLQQVHRSLEDRDVVAGLHVVVALLEVHGVLAAHEVLVPG